MIFNHWTKSTEVRPSNIHGDGRFVLEPVAKGEMILLMDTPPDLLEPHKHQTYINHSYAANITLRNDREFYALRDIETGEELVWDYRELNVDVPKDWR